MTLEQQEPPKKRRSRRVVSAPSNVLSRCVDEIGKLDPDEQRRVLASLRAWFEGE